MLIENYSQSSFFASGNKRKKKYPFKEDGFEKKHLFSNKKSEIAGQDTFF